MDFAFDEEVNWWLSLGHFSSLVVELAGFMVIEFHAEGDLG
jgi:hypothetical protein